ncbi:hypothetical protein KAS50_04230, partial [bacterium]|nr:hypothetical protein [bacterium]
MYFTKHHFISILLICFLTMLCFPAFVHSAGDKPAYLDSNQPIDKRVEDLLARMTLEEKVGQMNMP